MSRVRRIVLCYHAVSESWESPLAVTPATVVRQAQRLQRLGYVAGTVSDVMQREPFEPSFAITFDDAYRSVFISAAPLLVELGIPATVFVPTSFVGHRVPVGATAARSAYGDDLLRTMDWGQLRELLAIGWELGAHGHSHSHLTRMALADAIDDVRRSKVEVEEKGGKACRSFAYPYGMANQQLAELVRDIGYASAFTLSKRASLKSPHLSPRVGVYRGDGDVRFALKTSRVLQRVRTSTPWALAP
jgi:peptidoglycan/xylan/chitin deacetylase (PgdA/CDA1 family)